MPRKLMGFNIPTQKELRKQLNFSKASCKTCMRCSRPLRKSYKDSFGNDYCDSCAKQCL